MEILDSGLQTCYERSPEGLFLTHCAHLIVQIKSSAKSPSFVLFFVCFFPSCPDSRRSHKTEDAVKETGVACRDPITCWIMGNHTSKDSYGITGTKTNDTTKWFSSESIYLFFT